ncbi:dienelactone hydrolase [Rhizobium sp. SSA_523]|uniref:alpha/beta hydrolase family protein n=1 Tax=Rhizobium sp. SSA_523 TaxID=2952477 RepID=UPI0020911D49|nr:dienelactone hydrolase [Rhizobium sp. SSA_523]MCO5734165.1 dienelactone hydrolase [Rhizobium sp. SSA_523]WKC21554.1 dienelactone hydrolase [Rhizobium sp. SSA_523]
MTTNNLIDLARHIATPDAALTIAYSPIRLEMEGRQPLELRLTAPASGSGVPIIILSHGYGPSHYVPSKDGYAPLAQFWAERGFAVLQPTHASSRVGGLPADLPNAPFFWRERVQEMSLILDRLPEVERLAPALAGRLDHSRIAAAGHSFGGHTVGLLLGASLHGESFFDPRIKAGILLASPGRGGRDLTPESAARFPFFDLDFSSLATPSLVVCGEDDNPHFTPLGPEWHADAYHDSAAVQALLTLTGVGHGLGGIAGLDAKETEIEAPDVLEAVKRMTLAWLRTELDVDAAAWASASSALSGPAASLARLSEKTRA